MTMQNNNTSSMPVGLSVHNIETLEQKQKKKNNNTNNNNNNVDNSYRSAEDLAEAAEIVSSLQPQPPFYKRLYSKWISIYTKHSFLILVICAILLAYAYPPLGAEYLAPQITATWIAVIFIFILAGMGIKTEEFAKAFQRIYFNIFVQLYNFGVVSGIVYGFSRFMVWTTALPQSLADGMVICASLPITVNMVLVLTKASGGEEARKVRVCILFYHV